MAHSIQILDKTEFGFKVNTKEIFETLAKIGDKKIAVISINGKHRTGKSFLLNYILRYLEFHETCGENWIKEENNPFLNGFDWRGGADRHTVGIWMWSEPYHITDKNGSEVELLLLDTQGNFDELTTFQEIGVIFSFSLLMSSTLILNLEKNLREDDLQFVEFFAMFADKFNSDQNYNCKLFQSLVFLIRDWQHESSYPFGYHSDSTPAIKNHKREKIDANPSSGQVIEAQKTRKEIAKYFNQVSSYLMPYPGSKVAKESFKGELAQMEQEFIDNIANFVSIILSPENVEFKQFGGQALTGNSLKEYIYKWAEVIDYHKFPEAKTLVEASAEINDLLAQKHALREYEVKMRALIEDYKPSDELLFAKHEVYKMESLVYYKTQPKSRLKEHIKEKLIEELQNSIDKNFEIFQAQNNSRIEREMAEIKVQEFEAALKVNEEKIKESDSELSKIKFQLLVEKDEAKKRELELKEQNSIKEMELRKLEMDNTIKLLEMEKKNAEDKREIERNLSMGRIMYVPENPYISTAASVLQFLNTSAKILKTMK